MAVAVGSPIRAAPGGRQWPSAAPKFLIGLAILAIAAVLVINLAIQANPPAASGSVNAWLGDIQQTVCDSDATDESATCFVAPYAEDAGVGLGFTVRNTAPIPMTIVAVEGLEAPFLTPAYLHPELVDHPGPEQGYLYGLDAGQTFEPVEVAPGEEVPLQLVGTFLPCDVVAGWYSPGSALIVDHARMTLRWGFFETQVNMPLGGSLTLPAPESCP
jgi:hypothetical protein